MSVELQETCVNVILILTIAFVVWQTGKKLFFKTEKKCKCEACAPVRRSVMKKSPGKRGMAEE